jgi:hypothetical protein
MTAHGQAAGYPEVGTSAGLDQKRKPNTFRRRPRRLLAPHLPDGYFWLARKLPITRNSDSISSRMVPQLVRQSPRRDASIPEKAHVQSNQCAGTSGRLTSNWERFYRHGNTG